MKVINVDFLDISKNGILKLILGYMFKDFQDHISRRDCNNSEYSANNMMITNFTSIARKLDALKKSRKNLFLCGDALEGLASLSDSLDVYDKFKELMGLHPILKEYERIKFEHLGKDQNLSDQDLRDLEAIGITIVNE